MTKTLAEQLREYINSLGEDSGGKPKVDLTVYVDNWIPAPEDETIAWDEEVPVGIVYAISGKHYPATLTQPEENPELEIIHLYDMRDGSEIFLDEVDIKDKVEAAIWDNEDGKKRYNDDF